MKGLGFCILFFCLLLCGSCNQDVQVDNKVESYPEIFPDYIGVTIPPNIAPLNFRVEDDSISMVDLDIQNSKGKILSVQSGESIFIPQKDWNRLLFESVGDSLMFTLKGKKNGKWSEFKSFPVYVSQDSIDYGLSYRLIAPGYEVYSKMGIYQRSLGNFDQTPIVENTLFQGSCMNCHSYRQTNSSEMSIHIRGAQGGTAIMRGESLKVIDTKTKETLSNCVYPYWHPSGKYIAYSVNKTQQAFHASHNKRIEVFDHASDVVVFDVESNQLFSCDFLKSEENFETFPAFSPDGKSLYFCSSKAKPLPGGFNDIKYNLLKIDFDPETGTFSNKVDTLVNASEKGKSISFPRPSYDGKYIMYSYFDYGNFSIWHPESDLWLYDIENRKTNPLKAFNSDQTESYHSWSSNSRWVVFSSRRVNGLYTMPYLGHLDQDGNAGKPFLLPQKTPDFYDMTFYSFNIPEFINQPVNLDIDKLEKRVNNEHSQVEYMTRD
jgi:Tol biopolymer transport system component